MPHTRTAEISEKKIEPSLNQVLMQNGMGVHKGVGSGGMQGI